MSAQRYYTRPSVPRQGVQTSRPGQSSGVESPPAIPANPPRRAGTPGSPGAEVLRPRAGRVSAQSRAAELRRMAAKVDALRPDALSSWERAQLDVLAFGYLRGVDRQREGRQQRQALALAARKVAAFVASRRERALVASLGEPGATVQRWSGVIGAEGSLTGDGRVIAFGALEWAAFPLPLRWVKSDVGGHDGAIIVGRIDAVHRRPDGTIWASGLLDLGSEDGREAARLIAGRFLSGVSMDLDSVDSVPARMRDQSANVTTSARVRAATLVAIPAFSEAVITLSDDSEGDDCDCEPPTTPGLYAFTAPTRSTPNRNR